MANIHNWQTFSVNCYIDNIYDVHIFSKKFPNFPIQYFQASKKHSKYGADISVIMNMQLY